MVTMVNLKGKEMNESVEKYDNYGTFRRKMKILAKIENINFTESIMKTIITIGGGVTKGI